MRKSLLFLSVSFFCVLVHAKELSRSEVDEYLDKHPEVIEEYLVKKQQEMFKKIGEIAEKFESEEYVKKILDSHSELLNRQALEEMVEKQKQTISVLDNTIVENDNKKTDETKSQTKTQKMTEYVLGNPEGTFIIKAIYDYQCGWCRKSYTVLRKMLQSEKAKNIKIILMPNPIFGQLSELLTKYVLAAAHQGKLSEMHNAVFEKKVRSEEDLLGIAKELNLDIEQLKKDAHGEEIRAFLDKTKQMSISLGLMGVPAFVINGEVHQGAISDKKAEEILKMQE